MSIEVRSDDVVVICGKRRSGKSHFMKELIKGFKRRIIYDLNWEHEDLGLVVRSTKVLREGWKSGINHVVYQPINTDESDFEKFIETVWTFHDVCLIIEELEKYAKPHHMPRALKHLVDVGRHHGIGLVCTARRISMLSADIPFNADHIFVFKVHRPQDLDLLRQWVGDEIYKIRDAPEYSFVHYDDRAGTTCLMQKI
ncbi:MAG: hypothetical protein KKD44_25785 [Proteobacteria bacterium]|nr:hypothetical protein [Pseudomonadota bacterium]